MILYLIGIDYKTAPLKVREALYRHRKKIIDFLCRSKGDAVALFTCNRVEIYGIASDKHSAAESIYTFRKRFPVFNYATYSTGDVISHALRLASGLESQIVGEKQIMVQLHSWINTDFFPQHLKTFWVEILSVAQDIRTTSGLNEDARDISRVVISDVLKKSTSTRQKIIIVIGTGKIARLFSESRYPDVFLYFASRKKHSKARQLAKKASGEVILIEDLARVMPYADAIVSATTSPHYVIKRNHFDVSARANNGPLYVYDLAIPRDIEPEIGNIPGIYLQNLDDIVPDCNEYNQCLESIVNKVDSLIAQKIYGIKENINAHSHSSRNAPQYSGIKAG